MTALRPKDLALYLLLPTMELVSGYALLLSVGALQGTRVAYALIWLLLLAAFMGAGVAAVVSGWSWPQWAERGVLLAGGLGLAGAIGLEVSNSGSDLVLTILLLVLAYWRGVVAAADEPDYDEVRRRFGLGFGLLFTGVVWVVVGHESLHTFDWQLLSSLGIIFVILSMVALALARLETRFGGQAGGAYSIALTLQLGAVALVALAALQLLSIDIVGGLFDILRPLWNVLGLVLLPALQLLLSPLFALLTYLREHRPASQHATLRLPPVRQSDHRVTATHAGTSPFVTSLEIVIGVLFLGAIVVLLWRVMPRLRRPTRQEPEHEETSTVTGGRSAWVSILAWVRALLFGSAQAVVAGLSQLSTHVTGPPLPDDPVRRAYVRVLRRARSAGLDRPAWITPQEFRGRLAERWPEGTDDFALLTDAYEIRRYGEVHDDVEHLGEIESLCARLQTLMRT